MKRVLCLFGTRAEIIELAPVLRALDARRERIATLHVASSQDPVLLHGVARDLDVRIDRDLQGMERGLSPSALASRLLGELDSLIQREAPDLLLIQGDTTTALACALAGFQLGVPVGHLEAGPRSGDLASAFPEEMNRRLIARLASLHCTPTAHNAAALRAEGVLETGIALTDDPTADAIERFLEARATPAPGGRTGSGPAQRLADFVAAAKRRIVEIEPEEARRLLEAPDREGWHFVDVREPDEFAAGHVPGARSSPRGFLEVRADLEHYKRDPWFEDRARKLVLYCGGGHRSALAAQVLQQMGFTRVVSLAEGWTGWTERNYPQER